MNDERAAICAHAACTCEVAAGQTYCGPHCANAATAVDPEGGEPVCGCGHPDCAGARDSAAAA